MLGDELLRPRLAFVDDPWFLAGTAVPDWLNVSDRGVRVRPRKPRRGSTMPTRAWRRWPAASPSIMPTTPGSTTRPRSPNCVGSFTARLRDVLAPDDGMRPAFSGHILVEILLDAAADRPAIRQRLERYYAAPWPIDPAAGRGGGQPHGARGRRSGWPGFDSACLPGRDSCGTTPRMANCAFA